MTRATLEPTQMDSGTRIDAATDEALLARFWRQREVSALSELVHRYQHTAYRVAFARCGQRDLAEDATQDAFVELARKSGPSAPTEFRPWFLGLVHNMARRRMRSERRTTAREHSARYKEEAGEVSERRQAVQAPSVDRETRHALGEALEGLGEDLRVPLVLCFMEGLSQEEAGQVVGVSQPMIARRIARGLETLRARLALQGFAAGALALPVLLKDPQLLPLPVALGPSLAGDVLVGLAQTTAAESMRRAPVTLWPMWIRAGLGACLIMAAGAAYWVSARKSVPAPSPPQRKEAALSEAAAMDEAETVVPAELRTWRWDFQANPPGEKFLWGGHLYWRPALGGTPGGLAMGGADDPIMGALLLPHTDWRPPLRVTLQILNEHAGRYRLRGEWFSNDKIWPAKVWNLGAENISSIRRGQKTEWSLFVLDRYIVHGSRRGQIVAEMDAPPSDARLGVAVSNLLLTGIEVEELSMDKVPDVLLEACRTGIRMEDPVDPREAIKANWSSMDSLPRKDAQPRP